MQIGPKQDRPPTSHSLFIPVILIALLFTIASKQKPSRFLQSRVRDQKLAAMSSHSTAWYPNDTEADMPHQGPYPFNDFASYQFGTSHNQALQSSDDGSQLSPIDIPGSCAVAQYPVDFFEELQEVEEPSPNTGLKLGYRRASTACSTLHPPLSF